jgi:hypothetical protein
LDSQLRIQKLADIKDNLPDWKMPIIKAVIRKTGKDIDYEIEEQWDGENGWGDYEEQSKSHVPCQVDMNDGDEGEDEDDDSLWYASAEKRMSYKTSKKDIKELKHMYLPTRRTADHPVGDGWIEYIRSPREYFSDSEGKEEKEAAEKRWKRKWGDYMV